MDTTEEEEQIYLIKLQRRKKLYLYVSFLVCVLSIALVSFSLGTQSWYTAPLVTDEDPEYSGHFNTGLFKGRSVESNGLRDNEFIYSTVCLEGWCLFSCADTKEGREAQLDTILHGDLQDVEDCQATDTVEKAERSALNKVNVPVIFMRSLETTQTDDYDNITSSSTDGLLSQGLWGATIGCLAGGLLFTAIASVFTIINTATTPVEAITGIPGLYIWNLTAAFLELIAVITWSVEFSQYLSKNVLVVDSKQGWTTEGQEQMGYSFWLVVVSIIVHLGNCGIIAYGTYEPKVKEKIQKPDKATNDILLY